MKLNKILYSTAAALAVMGLSSCEDFLDRPTEDNYVADGYYQTEEQCYAGVNYLYNSPWYDFQRGFFKVGEVLSGNYYWGSSPYLQFSVNGTDEDLVNMSYSLWAVASHSSVVYQYLQNSPVSESVKNACMGEALTWKAMAYFYLVRTFGDVPIIHDPVGEISAGTYNDRYKVRKQDVYDYIIMTLEKAMELLPRQASKAGRIDYYCAEGLLAKVYLTKAGVTGSLNADDLAAAARYAKDVIDNSGRSLLPVYNDVFTLENNESEESLLAWRWTVSSMWTSQNTLQSDLAYEGMDEYGDCWGGWNGPSVDLQKAFGVRLLEQTPDAWINGVDTRRKASMMLPGDVIPHLWRDHGGLDFLRFIYDDEYNPSATHVVQSPTGANVVKHLYGNNADHVAAGKGSAARMASALATHILRLSDVYLIYAEAMMGTSRSTSDASAIDAFYAVRNRAIASATRPSSITWDDLWKERRLELCLEGDRWYDYVRVSYYDPQFCINEITSQDRNGYAGVNGDQATLYRSYYETGQWAVDPNTMYYDETTSAPNVTVDSFQLPFPTEDVVFNPHLLEEPIEVDVRSEYSY